ncbi:hypothetical protein, partial [Frankia sp. CpI1-P]
MDKILANFVSGVSSQTAGGETMSILNPSTGELFAEAPRSGPADVDA